MERTAALSTPEYSDSATIRVPGPAIWESNRMQSAIEAIRDWQTLITGFLALTAAAVTVLVMMRQVRIQKRQLDAQTNESNERRRRRLMACRAVLPADLSSVCRYARDCARVAGTALQMLREHEERAQLSIPTLPNRVTTNLQNLIEEIDESDADAIADLLSCYQVQYARLSREIEDFNSPNRLGAERITTENNIEFTLERTVRLYLLAENIFGFARGSENQIPKPQFNRENIGHALMTFELDDVVSRQYREELLQMLLEGKDRGAVA